VIWLEMFCWRLFDGYSNMHRRWMHWFAPTSVSAFASRVLSVF
jgi:hypothetical protein